MARKLDAADVNVLVKFIGEQELRCLADACKGEEGEFFFAKLREIAETLRTMPKVYEQDGLGDQTVVHLHYFRGNCDWWITERDQEDDQLQAFGLAQMGGYPELGYISIAELKAHNVELDLYWTPKTLAEVKAKAA